MTQDTVTWLSILDGIVGSHAYGLATENSDVDRLTFAVAPTSEFHGLNPPVGKAASRVSHEPDVTVHEIGKAVSLLLKCNPTVTELLWLDKEHYQYVSPHGSDLIAIREKFLSADYVRNAYLGYATSQLAKLRSTERAEKHARHLLRLLRQGIQLYTTGRLAVRVENPEYFFDFGRKAITDPHYAARVVRDAEDTFDSATTSLPDKPDRDAAEQFLRNVRADFFQAEED